MRVKIGGMLFHIHKWHYLVFTYIIHNIFQALYYTYIKCLKAFDMKTNINRIFYREKIKKRKKT